MKILALLLTDYEIYFNIINILIDKLQYDLIGVVTNKININNYPIYSLEEIKNLDYDLIIYDDYEYINDVINKYKLTNVYTIKYLLKLALIKKYENYNDKEILNTIEYWKNHELSVFNQYVDVNTLDKVFFDEQLPYIFFKVNNSYKKMYFPKDYKNFVIYENESYVYNLLTEQLPTSPHLYITDKHYVRPEDVVIDAGVCEGNFILQYIDICSKAYLIESDEMWIEPLKYTFKNYYSKIELIHKNLTDNNNDNNIMLDDINIDNKNVFIKMDIEGAEPSALRGGKKLLNNNYVNASICTYHTSDDLIKVKSLLEQYNFSISVSNGYMLFLPDINIFNTLDFRKGIVYASNYLNLN